MAGTMADAVRTWRMNPRAPNNNTNLGPPTVSTMPVGGANVIGTVGAANPALPDTMSQDDPWAWQAWAAQRDPSTYGWRDLGTAGQDPISQMLLEKAGLWNPDSPVSGYTMRDARGPGYQRMTQLLDKDGKVVSQANPEAFDSYHGDTYRGAIGTVGAVLGAGYGIQALAGAGGAAAAGSGAGMTASEQVALMAANGMTDAEIAAALGTAGSNAAGLTGVTGGMAGAAGGATGAATSAGSSAGSGAWNGTNFTGATQAGTAGMGATDWINLANLAAGVWAADQAGDAASDATNAARGVADGQLQLSRDALDWYKQTYADQAPARNAAEQRAQQISDAQLRAMNTATDQAAELYDYNKTTFRPLEQRLVSEAQNYDTPERRMSAAMSAASDIDTSTAAAMRAQDRNLARSGIAPGSTKALAIAQDSAVSQGRNRGSAMTNATRNVEQQGYARMADAANMGRGIASQQATQQQIATTNGNSSVANSGNALGAATSGNQFMGQGYNTAISGMNSAGNLYNQVAGQQNAQDNALLNGVSGIGNFLGRTYGTSDKNKKKGTGKMADGKKALSEIERTPVHSGWSYSPEKGGPDDGGKKHIGPMAQDVRASMGEAAAPGGKVVDLVDMNGRMMAAIKQLSKDVKALKAEDEKEAA